jgi:hypothetical protein
VQGRNLPCQNTRNRPLIKLKTLKTNDKKPERTQPNPITKPIYGFQTVSGLSLEGKNALSDVITGRIL